MKWGQDARKTGSPPPPPPFPHFGPRSWEVQVGSGREKSGESRTPNPEILPSAHPEHGTVSWLHGTRLTKVGPGKMGGKETTASRNRVTARGVGDLLKKKNWCCLLAGKTSQERQSLLSRGSAWKGCQWPAGIGALSGIHFW